MVIRCYVISSNFCGKKISTKENRNQARKKDQNNSFSKDTLLLRFGAKTHIHMHVRCKVIRN